MEYKGKLYGKVGKSYFPLYATTDDWDALQKRVSDLEAENKSLRQSLVSAMLPDLDTDKAEELAMETDYACFAVEADGNEINKADAGAFFLEGYNYAKNNLHTTVRA